jgi:hypothetical protein
LKVRGVTRDCQSQHRRQKLIVHASIIAGFPATIETDPMPSPALRTEIDFRS